jgi:hypothetical protein
LVTGPIRQKRGDFFWEKLFPFCDDALKKISPVFWDWNLVAACGKRLDAARTPA